MRSSVADSLLALFTSRERAASIVGDLIELSQTRYRGWFASQVIRLAFALCARSLVNAPGTALWLAVLGLVAYAVVYAVLFVASGLPWYPWHRIFDLGFMARLVPVVLLANVLTGAILARGTRGGMRAIAPIAALWFAAGLVWPFLAWRLLPWPSHATWHGLIPWPPLIQGPWTILIAAAIFSFLYILPLLLGAVLAERRAVRAARR